MKIVELIKQVAKLNKATEEYNKSIYSYQKDLDLTLNIYCKMVAGESNQEWWGIRKGYSIRYS